MLWRTPVLLGETLNFFKASNDSLVTSGPSALFPGRCKLSKIFSKII